MAQQLGKGSLLLKILIVILAAVLVAVIIIPGKIWKEEAQEEEQCHLNISSIYEAERFYYRSVGEFTTDMSSLLKVVREDTNLQVNQKVVNYTTKLKVTLDELLRVPFIHNLNTIAQNIRNIKSDLESNKRYFQKYEDFIREAEDIIIQIHALNVEIGFENYNMATLYLDSLVQLRRDLSDYQLQTAAARAYTLTDSMLLYLKDIRIDKVEEFWKPVAKRTNEFMKKVNRSDIRKVTSVSTRVFDFLKTIDTAFDRIHSHPTEEGVASVAKIKQNLYDLYQEFLRDFIITQKQAQYRLSESDSLVLHLTEQNFFCPTNNQQYLIFISDTNTVKVECPTLVSELESQMQSYVEPLNNLPFIELFRAYTDSLDSYVQYAYFVKGKLRRDTEIFILTKESEEIAKNIKESTIFTAYTDLNRYIDEVPELGSYSDLKEHLSATIKALGVFDQVYSENIFGKLDSTHNDFIKKLKDFDSTLTAYRRLPKDVKPFGEKIQRLEDIYNQIRNIDAKVVVPTIRDMKSKLDDLYLFAEDGKTVPVYTVFKKRIKNHGYIYRDRKSWEE